MINSAAKASLLASTTRRSFLKIGQKAKIIRPVRQRHLQEQHFVDDVAQVKNDVSSFYCVYLVTGTVWGSYH